MKELLETITKDFNATFQDELKKRRRYTRRGKRPAPPVKKEGSDFRKEST